MKTLPRKDPLASKHDEEFTYLRDAKRAIGLLKQAGLTPTAFQQIITENKTSLDKISDGLTRVFSERLSKESIGQAAALAETLSASAPTEDSSRQVKSLFQMTAVSLARAVELADEERKNSTTLCVEGKVGKER